MIKRSDFGVVVFEPDEPGGPYSVMVGLLLSHETIVDGRHRTERRTGNINEMCVNRMSDAILRHVYGDLEKELNTLYREVCEAAMVYPPRMEQINTGFKRVLSLLDQG